MDQDQMRDTEGSGLWTCNTKLRFKTYVIFEVAFVLYQISVKLRVIVNVVSSLSARRDNEADVSSVSRPPPPWRRTNARDVIFVIPLVWKFDLHQFV